MTERNKDVMIVIRGDGEREVPGSRAYSGIQACDMNAA